ncbi:MAG: hypothetical protein JWM44_1100 [Bacilli bacterium]|nr:hypothetical protein [Bacilli bacterium]
MTLTKHFNTKKLILTFVAVSILTLPTGCSKASKNQSQAPSSTQGKESLSPSLSPSPSPSLSPSPSATDTQQDQDLTKKLTSEKIVQSGQVYLAGNDAVAVIIIKKGTDEKTTKDLATKYANMMKKKYSNKKINAHAFIESKEIAHITL